MINNSLQSTTIISSYYKLTFLINAWGTMKANLWRILIVKMRIIRRLSIISINYSKVMLNTTPTVSWWAIDIEISFETTNEFCASCKIKFKKKSQNSLIPIVEAKTIGHIVIRTLKHFLKRKNRKIRLPALTIGKSHIFCASKMFIITFMKLLAHFAIQLQKPTHIGQRKSDRPWPTTKKPSWKH